MAIKIDKTVYDKPEPSDGVRVLVMRLWPRGVSKGEVDLWIKEVGTEKELIKLWKAGKLTWKEYSKRYLASLKGKESVLDELAARSKRETITLLCVEKDPENCHRSLLKQQIEKRL
jgi:uncharacterized protein YeaO (DUF488 family)